MKQKGADLINRFIGGGKLNFYFGEKEFKFGDMENKKGGRSLTPTFCNQTLRKGRLEHLTRKNRGQKETNNTGGEKR